MKDIHTPRVYMCDQCDYTAVREEYLKKHIKFTHDGEVLEKAAALVGYRIHQCNFCDHISNKMSNIKQHLKGVHKMSSSRLCSDCEFQTNSEAALKKHIHAAHDSGEFLKCNKSALQHSVVNKLINLSSLFFSCCEIVLDVLSFKVFCRN